MATDYTNPDLTIVQMVQSRLYFMDFTAEPALEQRLKDFIWEVMSDLEPCLRVSRIDWNNTQESTDSETPPWPDPLPSPDKVGHEEFYTMTMKILIANLVTVNALMFFAAFNASGGTSTGGVAGVFMSKAKADVVEVEWKQLTATAGIVGGIGLDTKSLIEYYTKQALRNASVYGCVLSVCDPCTLTAAGLLVPSAVPFIIVQDCNCGC